MASNSPVEVRSHINISWVVWLGAAACGLILSLALGWVSNRFKGLVGWESFLAGLVLATCILLIGWQALKVDKKIVLPAWLGWLVLGAAILRLAAGVFWFMILPVAGYGNPVELAGYVMADAHARDLAAWQLSQAETSLLAVFSNHHYTDQYGGLLFLSAVVYRYIGGQLHQPLLIVVITAAFSSLAVLFTWAFSRRAWSERVALVAACALALYPEAVLLGSSQMREAFTISLTMAAFYGLVRYWQHRSWGGLIWILTALLLILPFSPPFAAVVLGMLALVAFLKAGIFIKPRFAHHGRLWLILGGIALLVTIGVLFTWGQFAPTETSNPFAFLVWWIKKSAAWQMYLNASSSGWVQKVFQTIPEWGQIPFLVVYGILRPFLPAALVDSGSAALWRGIAIWRSAGWALLLGFLAYAPLRALWKRSWKDWAPSLSLVVWLGILIASFRSGGDLWDNPRYRVAFAGLQIALAAWAWSDQRQENDPWLKRALISFALFLIWIFAWYFGRYSLSYNWPVTDLFKNIGLGLVSAVLYLIWDWMSKKRDLTQPGERL